MYRNREQIVLASGSPRRQQLLGELGLEFTVSPGAVPEEPLAGEKPEHFVRRMAEEKAAEVSARYSGAWVIAADTVVCVDRKILGKPTDEREAVAQLMALSGREHRVMTGFCVVHAEKGIRVSEAVITFVRFVGYSEETARAYAATGEGLDKAGAYGIQGIGGCLVDSIEGSYSNVVGLPLCQLLQVLLAHEVIEPALPGR